MKPQPDAQPPGRYERGWLAGLSPNVVLLGWVSFFADVSSEMLYPLIPIFLTTVLNAPVALVGVIEGIAEAVASIMKPLAGRLSDASGKRRLYILQGYGLAACAKAILALAYAWPVALLGRVVDRFGKGLRTGSRDALLADSVDRANLGKALGFHRGMDTMGAVVGPLLALLLLKLSGNNLRLVLWLAVIPGLIGAALVLLIREQRRQAGAGRAAHVPAALPARFKWFLLVWGIFAFTNSSDVFILLKAKQLGLATAGVVLLYTLYNLTYAAASPALGRLSDMLGRRALLVSGLIVFGLVYSGFAAASSTVHLIILFAVYGLYMAATDGVSKAFAIDLVPAGAKATASGWLGMVTGFGALIASTTAGVLWDSVGPWAVFALGAGGALCAALALCWRPRVPRLAPDSGA
jgi:MFS family permease